MESEYIGVDLHKQFLQVCALTATGGWAWETRLPRSAGGDRRVLRTVWAAHARRGGSDLADVDVRGCRAADGRAGLCGRHAQDQTEGRVCGEDGPARRAAAGGRLATGECRQRVHPPPAIRELREICRGRHQVVRLRSRVSQMIRALLLRSGVADLPVRQVYSARGQRWLAAVALPPEAATTLQRLTACWRRCTRKRRPRRPWSWRAPRWTRWRVHARYAGRDRPGARVDAACRDRRRHALSHGRRTRLLRGLGAARRRQWGSLLQRAHHAAGVAVGAVGPGGGRASCDPSAGSRRTVGPAAGRAQRRDESARGIGAAPERRRRRDVATECVTFPLPERVCRFHRMMRPERIDL